MRKMLQIALVAIVGIIILGVSGCNKNSGSAGGGGEVDTSKLQSAFQTAPPVDKTEVENAISAVKSGNYSGALTSAQKVMSSANLTPEQKSAVQDFISQVQAKVTGMGGKVMSSATGAVNQAGEAAGKLGESLKK